MGLSFWVETQHQKKTINLGELPLELLSKAYEPTYGFNLLVHGEQTH